MFIIPEESIVFTSTECVSPYSNTCYITYNKAVCKYLESYKLMLKVLPSDIVRHVMRFNDPRLDQIHIFSKTKAKITVMRKQVSYRHCYRCFQKIIS